jgi:hypothetical protein
MIALVCVILAMGLGDDYERMNERRRRVQMAGRVFLLGGKWWR